MSRGSRFIPLSVNSYIEICEACASECEKHQDISHCQKCVEACHRTAEEYRQVANILDVA